MPKRFKLTLTLHCRACAGSIHLLISSGLGEIEPVICWRFLLATKSDLKDFDAIGCRFLAKASGKLIHWKGISSNGG